MSVLSTAVSQGLNLWHKVMFSAYLLPSSSSYWVSWTPLCLPDSNQGPLTLDLILASFHPIRLHILGASLAPEFTSSCLFSAPCPYLALPPGYWPPNSKKSVWSLFPRGENLGERWLCNFLVMGRYDLVTLGASWVLRKYKEEHTGVPGFLHSRKGKPWRYPSQTLNGCSVRFGETPVFHTQW